MKRLAERTGEAILEFLTWFGQVTRLAGEVVGSIVVGRVRPRLVLVQIVAIGFGSQLVVVIAGGFTGAVFAAQAYFKFSELGLGSATGPVVSLAMCRELGPVLAGLMVAGRVGAAMTAEISTMRVSEQIDALRSMGVDPVDYLVVPRAVAIVVSMPILVGEAIAVGILAADVLTVRGFGLPEAWFWNQLEAHTGVGDVAVGLIKGLVFGVLIVLIACRQGLTAEGGAVGVGRATTRAVVYASLAILISNLFLTLLLNYWFPLDALTFQ
ncbi:MAG: ABC transporter permease [Verrucomicrobiales bacterium]